MAWVAVDKDGSEWMYDKKPYRARDEDVWVVDENVSSRPILRGLIEELIGYKLTWEDEPVEYQ